MKKLLLLLALVCIEKAIQAQTPRPPYIYTIKADSVLITNSCDTAELILENHTQNVPGFLFNKGRGRTEFRKVLQKISDTLFTIGVDSLKLPNAWLQGGNAWGTTGILGTKDKNAIDFYTNNTRQVRLTDTGNLQVGNQAFDSGDKLQVSKQGAVNIPALLSRPGDVIQIGHYLNTGDGQNVLIRTSSDYGANYRNVLVERDGNIGMGWGSANGWNVGLPTFRISAGGLVSVESQSFYFGSTGGPFNSSALITSVSNTNEWHEGSDGYPNGQNYYYFGTILQSPTGTNIRAPLKISGYHLDFLAGAAESEVARITENRNMLIGTTYDNGFKLQVSGNVFADGNLHKIGKLAIVSGANVGSSGFATGIRIDDTSYGSMMFQGTSQGWAKDMFVFMDAYNAYGQDVYYPDQSMIRIKGGIKSNNAAGNSANALNISPEYKLNPAIDLPLTMRGIYYNPKLTSIIPGSKHIAIETVSGDVLFGTTAGNVGIGTNTPSAQLHTTGTVRFGGLTNDNTQSKVIVSDANGNLYYRDASSLAFNNTMNSDLAINGTLSAQKMKITQTSPWPDYVFSNQYKLPTLLQLEQYIKQNNHLPDVPSAAEVEKKGIDVGDNQATLLKKIEELTLYVIEQEKKLQQQNEEISILKKQNAALEDLKQQMAELKALIKSAQK